MTDFIAEFELFFFRITREFGFWGRLSAAELADGCRIVAVSN